MLKYSVKIFLGLIFIVSAILKLKTIDDFELYIFSIDIFALDVSILIARLIIGFELLLGIMLCLNIYKAIVNISIFITLSFTAFLLYKVFAGDIENCQCFGSKISLTPMQSVLKNIIILAGLFWVRNSNYFTIKYKKIITSILFLTSLTTPNIVSPPDFLYYKEYSLYATYDSESFENFMVKSKLKDKKNEKQIICFLSTKCKLCYLAAKKISTVVNNHEIAKEMILYVFIESDEILEFLEDTKSTDIPYMQLPEKELLSITQGGVPLLILYENKVIDSSVYRSIEEQRIVNFIFGDKTAQKK